MAGRTVSCVAVCRASVAAGAVSLAFVETPLCVLARASTAFLTALRCWDLLMSSLMFSPASCVSVLMAVGLLKMSMAVLLVTRPFWVTSSAARSSRSPLPVLRVDGLHVGLVQPPDFCVGDGLPGVELLLELHGQLVALGAGGRLQALPG